MKTKSLITAAFLGTLAVLPAHGFGYWNSATYASRFRPAPETQPNPVFQVAVLATLPNQSGRTAPTVSAPAPDPAHPFGPPKPCVTKAH